MPNIIGIDKNDPNRTVPPYSIRLTQDDIYKVRLRSLGRMDQAFILNKNMTFYSAQLVAQSAMVHYRISHIIFGLSPAWSAYGFLIACTAPPLIACLLNDFFVQRPLITEQVACSVCLESRAALIGSTVGICLPAALSAISSSVLKKIDWKLIDVLKRQKLS
ncbi:hypothetical protein ACOME3_006569 [Neoechinorhynchus agilis]